MLTVFLALTTWASIPSVGVVAEVAGFPFLHPEEVTGAGDDLDISGVSMFRVVNVVGGTFVNFPKVTGRETLFVGFVKGLEVIIKVFPAVTAASTFFAHDPSGILGEA